MLDIETTHSHEVRPIFRWAGSKRKLVPVLRGYVPSFSRYVEPFVGSACLYFSLQPQSSLLGDSNAQLIQAYRAIRNHPRKIARSLAAMPRTQAEYYRQRRIDPLELTADEAATRFVYLNRLCFNGVYRVNRDGQFNVPMGTRTGQFPPEEELVAAGQLLRKAELFCGDFEACLEGCKPGDFVYVDPPYAAPHRHTYGEYGYDCFAECDLPRLIACLERLERQGISFLLSYSARGIPPILPSRWHVRRLRVRRHIAGFASARRDVFELLVSDRSSEDQRG